MTMGPKRQRTLGKRARIPRLYPSKNAGGKICKYGSQLSGIAHRCFKNPNHRAVANPDRRKQNGNKYYKKGRARMQPRVSGLKPPTIRRSTRIAMKNIVK
jgi:hypothetical protein